MNDLISRQAAIATAISGRVRTLPTTEDGENWIRVNEVRDSLLSLPSAQSEHPSEIQDILDYLDTALHPIISPEYWNVYSELYDMVSTLPSAERRGRWKPVTNGRGGYECCICHNYAPSYMDGVEWLSTYCPTCGAKMDEVDE